MRGGAFRQRNLFTRIGQNNDGSPKNLLPNLLLAVELSSKVLAAYPMVSGGLGCKIIVYWITCWLVHDCKAMATWISVFQC